MPGFARRQQPLRAELQVLSWNPATSSTSSQERDVDYAVASPELYLKLVKYSEHATARSGNTGHEGEVGIAVDLPQDRRLSAKGKGKSLVVSVRAMSSEAPVLSQDKPAGHILYLPQHLLPLYTSLPLHVSIYQHRPIELSLAILQPILGVRENGSDEDSTIPLDFSPWYGSSYSTTVVNGPGEKHRHMNGNGNGHGHNPSPEIALHGAKILREQQTVHLDSTTFKVLMLEPVNQGILTPSTRIILSSSPLQVGNGDLANGLADMADGASSQGKSHISMDDFDPDVFLSSSLARALSSSPPLGVNGHTHLYGYGYAGSDTDTASTISSTPSGSITPRPGMYPSPVASINGFDLDAPDENDDMGGVRFTARRVQGRGSSSEDEEDVCWVAVGGLARAGIFEGDWVCLRGTGTGAKSSESGSGNGNGTSPFTNARLVKVLAWEKLDEPDDELPGNPILLPPHLYRSLFPTPSSIPAPEVILSPTSFGARIPSLPTANTLTLARIATTAGIDKRYERSWLQGLRRHFQRQSSPMRPGGLSQRVDDDEGGAMLVRRGDIISIPIWQGRPLDESADEGGDQGDDEEEDEDEDDYDHSAFGSDLGNGISRSATALAYFIVTSLSFDPLVPLEEDFRTSISSKARAGEMGCWVDVGEEGSTRMVLTGLESGRVAGRQGDAQWHDIPYTPSPFNISAAARLRDLLASCFSSSSFAPMAQLSVLVKGARGSGKLSLVRAVADEIGYNVVLVECYDIVGESSATTEGTLLALLEKARSCSPSILLLNHVEGLAKKSESSATGRQPAILKVLGDLTQGLQAASGVSGWPSVLMGTTGDEESVPGEVLAIFKQDISINAPSERERLTIAAEAFSSVTLAPEVALSSIAQQTAALQAGDIRALAMRARDLALSRAMINTSFLPEEIERAGLSLNSEDIATALNDARSSYSDSIGAPKIPNVKWDDIGGLAAVKADILDTIQLPLQHPELFAEGLKKRSGILLYGPPGTGKTLLAKAVATECSLNFFSVKGPELLNMYIGESEANVRRVFQRARDAAPCVIFMDELDSIAPKRGNQGDSGGVMDRIVSQLLAELDGMSSGTGAAAGSGDVFIMGATNRPDLLDPALLRPGRFDRMLYLSVATTHSAQLSILQALTRKFTLDPELNLGEISEMCPFNLTGADFYALCSDALLGAMSRKAEEVDKKIKELEEGAGAGAGFPIPLTPQYYLAKMATEDEIKVQVEKADFVRALDRLVPSVSQSEMEHYERVQREFKGYNIGQGQVQ